MKKIPCSRDCPDRCSSCHASCASYLAWKAEYAHRKPKPVEVTDAHLKHIDTDRAHNYRYKNLRCGW